MNYSEIKMITNTQSSDKAIIQQWPCFSNCLHF